MFGQNWRSQPPKSVRSASGSESRGLAGERAPIAVRAEKLGASHHASGAEPRLPHLFSIGQQELIGKNPVWLIGFGRTEPLLQRASAHQHSVLWPRLLLSSQELAYVPLGLAQGRPIGNLHASSTQAFEQRRRCRLLRLLWRNAHDFRVVPWSHAHK